MAINPEVATYGTNEPDQMAAVVDVDINTPNANRPERTSAKALAVYVTGGGGTSGGAIPVTVSPIRTDATSHSGTMTLGGTAQELMAANATRNGWSIQNQSGEYMYVRSRGVAGTTNATQDQNSIRLAPGQLYESPYVSPYAISVISATTGSAFWSREW